MSQNEIWYEKYRPWQLAHVIGQDTVVKVLTKTCEKEFFHHSYLLSGKHGTGKTSTARIIANLLVCEDRPKGSSVVCGKCNTCQSIKNGSSVDIYELDGASNSKIENTRSIIESSKYSPQQFKYKVYIIDECHRLSTAAMTSLLKTLEEPPSTSVFILCTTDFEKVPKEIVSRCQRLNFRPVAASVISSYLGRLFASKKVEIDQLALDSISIACKGSVRDALEIAQELVVTASGPIHEKDVAELLGFAGRDEIYSVVSAMCDADLIRSFDFLEQMLVSGVDARLICTEMSSIFRNIMISKISSKYIQEMTKTEQNFIEKIKDKISTSNLISFLSFFEEAERSFGVNLNNRWVLEAVVVKIIDKQTGK